MSQPACAKPVGGGGGDENRLQTKKFTRNSKKEVTKETKRHEILKDGHYHEMHWGHDEVKHKDKSTRKASA